MAWITENWFQLWVLGSLWTIAAAVAGVRRVLVEIHINLEALRERHAPRPTAFLDESEPPLPHAPQSAPEPRSA